MKRLVRGTNMPTRDFEARMARMSDTVVARTPTLKISNNRY